MQTGMSQSGSPYRQCRGKVRWGEAPPTCRTISCRHRLRGTLVTLVVQGMLEETEDAVTGSAASYENGVVAVNGTVIPIGAAAQALF